MRAFLSCFLIVFITHVNGQELKDVLWKNRVVVLFGGPNEETYKQQDYILKNAKTKMKVRDILIWSGSSKLGQQLDLQNDFKGLALIGKDGGTKLVEPFVVNIQELFGLIDSMPMRRAEMRAKKH